MVNKIRHEKSFPAILEIAKSYLMLVAIIVVFIVGYLCIALENFLKINKAATALITGVLCWTLYIISSDKKDVVSTELIEHMGNLSQILFFLLGAMTIVELIDAHDGFEIITRRITTKSKRKLIWILSFLSFFLSISRIRQSNHYYCHDFACA